MRLILDRHDGAVTALAVRHYVNRKRAALRRTNRSKAEIAMELADLEKFAKRVERAWLDAFGKDKNDDHKGQ